MKQFCCKVCSVNRKISVLIFAVMLSICGIQRMGYTQTLSLKKTVFYVNYAKYNDMSAEEANSFATLEAQYSLSTVFSYFIDEQETGAHAELFDFQVAQVGNSGPWFCFLFRKSGKQLSPGTEYILRITVNVEGLDVAPATFDVTIRDGTEPSPAPASGQGATPASEPSIRRVIYRCPVGWQKQNAPGQPTPKVFIRSVEVDVDTNRPSGIYKPVALEIYADPTEGLSDLAGWKLRVAVPYNHGREYRLTAENAVFNAEGIARIESPDTEPFPMTNLTYIGQVLPGFDYRLFSEKNTPVDFAISCYRGTNATLKQLEAMEKPRVVRGGDPTSFEWDDIVALLSKWRVPVAETAPAAPSLSSTQQRLTTMWGALKKR